MYHKELLILVTFQLPTYHMGPLLRVLNVIQIELILSPKQVQRKLVHEVTFRFQYLKCLFETFPM